VNRDGVLSSTLYDLRRKGSLASGLRSRRVIGLLALDGRIVGTLASTATLIVLAVVALGLFTSEAGLLIAGAIAAAVGIAASRIIEPRRVFRNQAVVVGYVGVLIVVYLLLARVSACYAPPGALGGPGITSPH
jgi:hypothetical protein